MVDDILEQLVELTKFYRSPGNGHIFLMGAGMIRHIFLRVGLAQGIDAEVFPIDIEHTIAGIQSESGITYSIGNFRAQLVANDVHRRNASAA